MINKIDIPFGDLKIDIERVIDVDSGKIFQIKADVLHRTSSLFLNKQTVIEYESQVPVHNDSNGIIGFAALSQEKDAIVAEIYLDSATPERLSLETDGLKFWPHINIHPSFYPDTIRIASLCLLSKPTDDSTIQAINA